MSLFYMSGSDKALNYTPKLQYSDELTAIRWTFDNGFINVEYEPANTIYKGYKISLEDPNQRNIVDITLNGWVDQVYTGVEVPIRVTSIFDPSIYDTKVITTKTPSPEFIDLKIIEDDVYYTEGIMPNTLVTTAKARF